MNYDVVLLDFDGTAFDTEESLFPVFLHGFEAIGRKCSPEDAAEYMHHSLAQAAMMAKLTEDEIKPWAEEIVRALDYEDSLSLVKIFPETKEFVAKLDELGVKMAIVTGNLSGHAWSLLKRFGISHSFQAVIGNDEYKKTKPDAEPCLNALKALGVEPSSRCVYIGDSLQDVECAHNAGIDGILIDRHDHHPDFVGKKIKSLLDIFNE